MRRRSGNDRCPTTTRDLQTEKALAYLTSGDFTVEGDAQKAVEAIYEVIVGEGVGKGKEAERYLPLGRDLVVRMKEVKDQLSHSLEVFEDVASNVFIEK
jgi:hypothetical protein